MRLFFQGKRLVAVGECGLDYWKNFDEYRDETEILGRRIMTDQPTPPPHPRNIPPSEIRPCFVVEFCGGILDHQAGSEI